MNEMKKEIRIAPKRVVLLLSAVFAMTGTSFGQERAGGIVDAADFISGDDATPGVAEALEYCRATGARKLVFPHGEYHFLPALAMEKYAYISNNDHGLKRFAFDLTGMTDFEIDGGGSDFVFHGYLCPFLVENAKNMEFRNFSIDYERTFHSEGFIEAAYRDSIDVRFTEAYPYRIENGELVFTDAEGTAIYPWVSLLEFDPVKRESAYKAPEHWWGAEAVEATELSPGRVRIRHESLAATVGNVMTFGTSHRLVPVFSVASSENLIFQNLDLYHGGGMGIIAQHSRDITVDSVKVTPRPGSGRVVSITCDATHFVNCSGEIRLVNCLFENQKDDATNIHGLYARIDKVLSDRELLVKMVHPQQFGIDFLFEGDEVEFVGSASLVAYAENKVSKVERVNQEYTRVTFRDELSDKIAVGDGVATLGEYPDVLVKNCVMRGNRARGILLGSRGRIVVEGNYFHSPGAAILLEGDCRFWYEQSGVRDLVVRNNVFDNCFYGIWGTAVIQVGSGIDESEREHSRYNRNIVVENNTFRIFTPQILDIYSVDNLLFRNNTIERTTDYPAMKGFTDEDMFTVKHSSGVVIE